MHIDSYNNKNCIKLHSYTIRTATYYNDKARMANNENTNTDESAIRMCFRR